MNLFGRKKKENQVCEPVVQTAARELTSPLAKFQGRSAIENSDIYFQLKNSIPIVDAAIEKIIRLMGGFDIACGDEQIKIDINNFFKNQFFDFQSVYMNQLLTYGTAVGEIVLSGDGRDIYSLVNVPLKNINLRLAENNVDVLVYPADICGNCEPFKYQNLLLVSALNPEPGKVFGVSLLNGLEFVSDILMKIYNAIGTNWERVGNVRFAVTYKPSNDSDRAMSKQRAKQIADEWSKAMRDNSISDFVSVGDVSIKVIGADNQILDSEVPVKQMLEQITAKLSVPPFLLGLSWSTTERMSTQQADILTSELEYYRRIMNGVISKTADIWFQLHGIDINYKIVWDNINLQDEVELARSRLYNAQADALENKKGGE